MARHLRHAVCVDAWLGCVDVPRYVPSKTLLVPFRCLLLVRRRVRLPEPHSLDQYTLFLSSSDQQALRRLRRRVKTLVDDVVSPELRRSDTQVGLVVDLWEREAPGRVPEGETPNSRFVQLALSSHLTLVLIVDELRDGTREELEAVLAAGGPELMVLSFAPTQATPPEKLEALDNYFATIKEQVIYRRCAGPDSADAWLGLFKAITAFTVAALRNSELRRSERTEVR